MLSRRRFLSSLAAALPLTIFVRRAHAAAIIHLESDPTTLDALAAALLPAELGHAGTTNIAREFRDWGANYHENAELVHGYGTSRLRATGPTPLTRWTTHLDQLEAQAQSAHQRRFRDLTVAQRADLVRAALQGQRLDRMPSVGDANHVAIALLAYYFDSSAAADLCYNARVGRQTCRPLSASSRKPLPMIKLSER
jgi:hypothetical protein